MLSRVGSWLGSGAAIVIGGVVGHHLRKHHEAGNPTPEALEESEPGEAIVSQQKEAQNCKTIMKIFRSLEEFTACSALRDPIAESHAERAKVECQGYLVGQREGVGGPGVWLAEWLDTAEWPDTVDHWPPPPSRRAPAPPTYTATLACGVRALWYISSSSDFCKGNCMDPCVMYNVFSPEVLEALRGVIEAGATKAAPMALKVVANAAVHQTHHPLIQDAGLVEVLAACGDHPHPYVFLPAWRGLHNLRAGDGAGQGTDVFVEGVYPFVAPGQAKVPLVDLVLVHGIEGGAPWTWRQRDTHTHTTPLPQSLRRDSTSLEEEVMDEYCTCCWPLDWLVPALGLPVRVLALDFPAPWSGWGCGSPAESVGKTLASHSREMSVALAAAGVGGRPIVWLCHSMGGLLVKHMLMEDLQGTQPGGGASEDPDVVQQSCGSLARQTRGAVFCSVPHHGSALATTTTTWPLSLVLQPTQEVREMRTDNPLLEVIHASFLRLAEEQRVEVLSLVESQPTPHTMPGWELHFVAPQHADPGVGEFCEVETTHRDICKPVDKTSDVYQKILHFLKDIVHQI